MNKQVERKNKILALILTGIALAALAGAITWFSIYAPQLFE